MLRKISEYLHRMKTWVEGFAQSPNASLWLFLVAFVEASLFPIPPDVLLIALCVANPRQSFKFAAICAIGSVAGSLLGYYIGYAFFETAGSQIIAFYGLTDSFQLVLDKYRGNAWLVIFVAGFTPIPYMLFTVAAGFNQTLDLMTLGLASLVGRSFRFLLVGALLFVFRERMKEYLDNHLVKFTIAMGAFFVAGIILVKYVF
ncbi:MAG: YqaA family protein [Bacteroidota bacterium]